MVVGRRDERRTSAERKGADIDQAASSFRPTTREQKEKNSAFAIFRLRGVSIYSDLAYQLAPASLGMRSFLARTLFLTLVQLHCCVHQSPHLSLLLLSNRHHDHSRRSR